MRVTDKAIYDGAIRDTAAARERLEAAQRIASTGLRVAQASDDPAAAGRLTALGITTARLDALASATGQASAELQGADTALGDVAGALVRARQLAVQLANPVYTADQRASGAGEIAGVVQRIVAAANTRVGNRWIFGGTADAGPPFSAAGAYQGSAVMRRVEIAPGVLQTSSIDADAALRGQSGGVTVGVDVVGTLQQLRAALAANDPAGVQATLDALDRSTAQLAAARAQAGIAMAAFDAAGAAARAAATDARKDASTLGDADIVQASIELTQAQQGLQASLAAAAQGFRLTLLDYLR